MLQKLASFTVTVRVDDVPTFLRAARAAGWSAVDSGERVTTEEGVAKEAVLVVRIPAVVEAESTEETPAAA